MPRRPYNTMTHVGVRMMLGQLAECLADMNEREAPHFFRELREAIESVEAKREDHPLWSQAVDGAVAKGRIDGPRLYGLGKWFVKPEDELAEEARLDAEREAETREEPQS